MSRIIRLLALLVVVGGLATALVAYATASGPPNHANRFEATFSETVKVGTNNRAAYGIGQVILTGSGTLEGFGAATEVGGVTADNTIQPCGAVAKTLRSRDASSLPRARSRSANRTKHVQPRRGASPPEHSWWTACSAPASSPTRRGAVPS